MSLSVAIVGLPNVGKSTLFNALLKRQQALAANYPFATIEPNVGVVPVPDERLQKLAEVVVGEKEHHGSTVASGRRSKESEMVTVGIDSNRENLEHMVLPPIVPATVKFIDIAGLVKGAHEGEGLGNQFLAHIRETDAIVFVVRAFEDGDVVRTGSESVGEDLKTVQTELMMADLNTLEKQAEPKGKFGQEEKERWRVVQKALEHLQVGEWLFEMSFNDNEREILRQLSLLSSKPSLYAINVGEDQLRRGLPKQLVGEYADLLQVNEDEVLVICAKMESDLAFLSEVEQKEYLASYKLPKSGLEQLISRAYERLNLISFLTAGEKEVRGWTITRGMTAVEAAAVIHTDFSKHFIKAEVMSFHDFVSFGGWKRAREAGGIRSEGRDYIMQEGEVVEFKVGV